MMKRVSVHSPLPFPLSHSTRSPRLTPLRAGYVHASWVYKQGDFVKAFRKRWFVLSITNLLHYYEQPGDKKPKGTIEMANVKEVRRGESKPDLPTPFVFEVVTAGRTYILCCETENDLTTWIKVIKQR